MFTIICTNNYFEPEIQNVCFCLVQQRKIEAEHCLYDKLFFQSLHISFMCTLVQTSEAILSSTIKMDCIQENV